MSCHKFGQLTLRRMRQKIIGIIVTKKIKEAYNSTMAEKNLSTTI